MRTRRLGRTDLEVSVITLGSWLTYGGSVEADTAVACMRRAVELGVNLLDTANVYAAGASEEVVGRALATFARGEVLVGTKVFFPVGPGAEDRGLGRAHVLRECDRSLARLGVERIDLYQCHRYDTETPLEETCRVMDDLVRAGKVRFWGVSEWTPEQIDAAMALCAREGFAPPSTDQPRYSLLERGVEDGVLDACARHDLGVLAFSPLAQGMLTGKYRDAASVPPDSRAADEDGRAFIERFFTDANFARIARLVEVATAAGMAPAELALAWVLRRPEVTSALIGASRPEQVEENVRAAERVLEGSILGEIERALGEPVAG
jgi:aryl-alcohol dehydrogenase-like predicted oxidoreductase